LFPPDAVGDLFQQVHDFEPGIAPSGLFWTVPVSPSSIIVNPETGTATLRVRDLAVPDFHDFLNAIGPTPTTMASHVSFEVRWSGGRVKTPVNDSTFDFSGTFIESDATIEFTARNDASSVVYRSDPAGQHSQAAGVGRERNGVFFS
jgi:hypothetical protein